MIDDRRESDRRCGRSLDTALPAIGRLIKVTTDDVIGSRVALSSHCCCSGRLPTAHVASDLCRPSATIARYRTSNIEGRRAVAATGVKPTTTAEVCIPAPPPMSHAVVRDLSVRPTAVTSPMYVTSADACGSSALTALPGVRDGARSGLPPSAAALMCQDYVAIASVAARCVSVCNMVPKLSLVLMPCYFPESSEQEIVWS